MTQFYLVETLEIITKRVTLIEKSSIFGEMKIILIFGTRPEAIKLFPVYQELIKNRQLIVKICLTSQQRELQDQVFDIFEVEADYDLNLMVQNQTLSGLTSKILSVLTPILQKEQPDWVLVHGDTTTAFAGALSAFNERIKVAHIEAGLRSGDLANPFPEEANRVCIDKISSVLFAPTQKAKQNLLNEGHPESTIHVTGNTAIDMILHATTHRIKNLQCNFSYNSVDKKKLILVTMHRRENIDSAIAEVASAITVLATRDDLQFVIPVHPNPKVKKILNKTLCGQQNVFLINPITYFEFIGLMQKSFLIITDSGGIQEEAPTLNVPVLVARETTERPEAVDVGAAKLVGTKATDIIRTITSLIENPTEYDKMRNTKNPFGDGKASHHIASFFFSLLARQ